MAPRWPVSPCSAIARAARRGIVVNTIHCGAHRLGVEGKWKHAAKIGKGSFLTIVQNHVARQIATPFDSELARLSSAINQTYIAYGREGSRKAARQLAQDSNAHAMGSGSMASRAKAKGGRNYKNASWDLVDGLEGDKKKLDDLKTAQLPPVMRKMNMKQRKAYVAKKGAERKVLKARIKKLSAKRERFVAAERKKLKKDQTSTFDKAMLKAIDAQMKSRGYVFED